MNRVSKHARRRSVSMDFFLAYRAQVSLGDWFVIFMESTSDPSPSHACFLLLLRHDSDSSRVFRVLPRFPTVAVVIALAVGASAP
jgi:hypothetical protein